jgi:CheY-like chemotaxis protein
MTRPRYILVADDNDNDLQLTLMALKRGGQSHEVAVAHDGVEVLDYLHCRGSFESRHRQNPDIILLDLKMPRMDGMDVLRAIRSDADLRMIPVVMLTSSREDEDVRKCYQLGVNAYVVKPVDFQQFMAVVQETEAFWTARNEPPPSVNGSVNNTGGVCQPTQVAA